MLRCNYVTAIALTLCQGTCHNIWQSLASMIYSNLTCSIHHLGHDGYNEHRMHEWYSNLSCGLVLDFHHRSGSALNDSCPNTCRQCARCAWKDAPALFSSNNTLTIMTDFPVSFPNSEPDNVHIFSLLDATFQVLNASAALTSISCNATMVSTMLQSLW